MRVFIDAARRMLTRGGRHRVSSSRSKGRLGRAWCPNRRAKMKRRHMSEPWQWYWRTENNEADCGIFHEQTPGHAYAVARCPRYQSKEQWGADAGRIVACVNACAGIPTTELEKAPPAFAD